MRKDKGNRMGTTKRPSAAYLAARQRLLEIWRAKVAGTRVADEEESPEVDLDDDDDDLGQGVRDEGDCGHDLRD